MIFQNDELENFTVSWSRITGKPSTFTPSSHTHTLNSCTGGLTDRPFQWRLGVNDYIVLRTANATSTETNLCFVYHDTSANSNRYDAIYDEKGNFLLSRTTHNHDDSYYPLGEASPANLPNTNLNSCRINITCAFSATNLNSYTNLPSKVIGIFRSTVCGSYCVQEYFNNESEYWHRIYTSEGWKAWTKS